jgi:hypothetical protein
VCHCLAQDPRFFTLLLLIDQELSAQTQAAGCSCSGRLHRANYPRKPRGCLLEFQPSFSSRWSFCCALCRKRTTAPSVRFLGRRVYLALVVVLSSSRHAGSNSAALALAHLAIPLHTVERWRAWWRNAFHRTSVWLSECARFMPPLAPAHLPDELLARLVGTHASDRLLALLRMLGPLTVRPCVAPAAHAA